MGQIFYRVHWDECPPLSADNAWSALWGSTRTADGTQTVCMTCDGTGAGVRDCPDCKGRGYFDDDFGGHRPCRSCGESGIIDGCEYCAGEGALDCQRGYSCFVDPQSLIEYFTCVARNGLVADDDRVIVFTGDYYGTGFDGEDLAVPGEIIEEVPWKEFLTR